MAETKKRGKNTYIVPFSEITADLNENPRKKYNAISELADSIEKYGIKNPLKCYAQNGSYHVVVGFRRFKALQLLVERGYNPETELQVPIQTYTTVPTEEEKLIDHQISNEGQQLTVLERAEIAQRWQKLGLSCTEIAEKMGYTYQQTDNFLKLSKAPQSLIDLINDGVVKSTLVVNLFKKSKDFETVELEILSKLHSASKVTQSSFDLPKSTKFDDSEEQEYDELGFPVNNEPTKEAQRSYTAPADDSDEEFDSKGREIKSASPGKKAETLEDRIKIAQSHINERITRGDYDPETEKFYSRVSNFIEMIQNRDYTPVEIVDTI